VIGTRRRTPRDEIGEWQAAGGTIETVDYAHEVGLLAAEGWTEIGFAGTDDIGVEAAGEHATGREHEDDGVPAGFRIDTPEGEVVPRGAAPITLGAGLGVDDFDDVAELCGVCDRLGLDIIGAGNAVAWAIRADEAGVVDCPVAFGDTDGIRRLLTSIAAREDPDDINTTPGLPDTLADGIDTAADRFGGAGLVPTVKSMALPGFDPRAAVDVALAYATSDRGGCHRRARPQDNDPFVTRDRSVAERVRNVVGEQNARSVLWSLVVDDFVGEAVWTDLGAEWLATIDHPAVDCSESAANAPPDPVTTLATTGERIWTLTRLFNVREGFDREDDALPARIRTDTADGTTGVDTEMFDRLLDRYYAVRGWGPDGLPTSATVERLGLKDIADDATPLADNHISPS